MGVRIKLGILDICLSTTHLTESCCSVVAGAACEVTSNGLSNKSQAVLVYYPNFTLIYSSLFPFPYRWGKLFSFFSYNHMVFYQSFQIRWQ